MNINQAVRHMVNGGKVRLDYWDEDEYITIKNGEFIDNWGQEFVMSPFMFEERFIIVE